MEGIKFTKAERISKLEAFITADGRAIYKIERELGLGNGTLANVIEGEKKLQNKTIAKIDKFLENLDLSQFSENQAEYSATKNTDIEKQLASIMFRLQAVEAYIAEQLSLVKNEE